jgi:uncharacterized protein GlcG (DUF336 family)
MIDVAIDEWIIDPPIYDSPRSLLMTSTSRILAAVFTLAAATTAAAQAPVPLAKAVVSDQVAARTLMKYQLNSQMAREIVNACVDFARTQPNGPGNYAIFVLSPTGDIIDAHVMDGVVPIGVETGLMKAKTALYARSTSRAVADRFNTVEGRLIRTDLGREQGLSYYFVPGGVPIVIENQIIGAIGVGGGNMDEQCAQAGLTKVLGLKFEAPAAPPAGGRQGGGGRGGN